MIHRVSFERDSVNSGPLTDEDAGDAETSEVSTRDSSGTGRGGVRRAKLLDLDMRVCGWLAVCMDVYGISVLRVYDVSKGVINR